jgi:hypothetical protein
MAWDRVLAGLTGRIGGVVACEEKRKEPGETSEDTTSRYAVVLSSLDVFMLRSSMSDKIIERVGAPRLDRRQLGPKSAQRGWENPPARLHRTQSPKIAPASNCLPIACQRSTMPAPNSDLFHKRPCLTTVRIMELCIPRPIFDRSTVDRVFYYRMKRSSHSSALGMTQRQRSEPNLDHSLSRYI